MPDTGYWILDGHALFLADVRAFYGLDEHVELLPKALQALMEIVVEGLVCQGPCLE